MAKNPFTALQDFVDKPKRNTFDLSYQNNLTMRFGKLYPVFCKEVVPGDSFRIEPTFGLRFMPLVFPIQTRMQANLHFFFVRNRNLWVDWQDFIGRTKQGLVPPYLSKRVANNVCRTKGLGDYFGVPTTFVGQYGSVTSSSMSDLNFYCRDFVSWSYSTYAIAGTYELSKERTVTYLTRGASLGDRFGVFSNPITSKPRLDSNGRCFLKFHCPRQGSRTFTGLESLPYSFALYWRVGDDYRAVGVMSADSAFDTVTVSPASYDTAISYLEDEGNLGFVSSFLNLGFQNDAYNVLDLNYYNFVPTDSSFVSFDSCPLLELIELCNKKFGNLDYRLCVFGSYAVDSQDRVFDQSHYNNSLSDFASVVELTFDIQLSGVSDVPSSTAVNPYLSGDIKISALPFRAYESIYNAFYRNQFNDPFKPNGVVEYNKFITNNLGGQDDTDYELYNRNYEMDFLTSAKQSPVDGDITPLVGVSGSGQFTFRNSDDTTYTVTPVIGEDGHTLTGIQSVEGTPENNSGVRRLTDMISVGISINDFRNVNALQRWLETNLRRGYRYKDQIMSHFGVEVRYDELDMPEFIGGMSEPVLVNQVSQTVDATDTPSGLGDFSKVLGSFAGQASVLASSDHAVDKYCDEHGFIIGILSITPVPNYSQLLPKMFVKDNVLDYYFPEFGHIGNQPIPYREVVPLQSYAAGDSLNDVFGYQRAWYDYLASVDEVHGDFRTSLEGFLINRVFDTRPELGKSFIEVDDTAMSNPFSVTGDEDKILGQIYFKVTAQRPIPKLGIPRLE